MNSLKYKKQNLLQKLYNREIYGQFVKGVSVTHEPAKQLYPAVPDRLTFPLEDTLPNIGNHVLMGATRCGQLLLTYTYTVDPSIAYSPTLQYRYRLHFWAFRPGKAANKVAEVQLFDSSEVLEVLTIGIIQWPNIHDRILVFGNGHGPDTFFDGWGTEMDYKSTTYITVTTIPSLNGCSDCRAVAASFDEEEMAANWDSGVGLTCLKHGLTIHTSFSVPYPYFFEPELHASVDGKVLINTGSFIHVLGFSLEKNGPYKALQTESPPSIVNVPITNRLSYSFLRDNGYSVFLSDSWAGNMTQMLIEKIQQGRKLEARELPFLLKFAIQKHLQVYSSSCYKSCKSKLNNCETVIGSLSSLKCQRQKWFNANHKSTRLISTCTQGKNKIGKRILDEADKIYDFKESDDKCEPKFKLFRRRCLADKMYEFRSDEDQDMENIRPNSRVTPAHISDTDFVHNRQPMIFGCNVDATEEAKLRHEEQSESEPEEESSFKMSKIVQSIIADWESPELEGELSPSELRQKNISRFVSGLLVTSTHRRQRSSHSRGALKPRNSTTNSNRSLQSRPKHSSCPEMFDLTEDMKKEMDRGFGHLPITDCSVHFTRRFIEIDQEITSTITDIEDDEIGPVFQCALPLSVHGSAYSQMEMISNLKAEKLNIMRAEVAQSTLDIEHFCYKAAEAICRMEGFKFWFCSDYDIEIINVCPLTDDKVFVVFIRLNAEDTRAPGEEETPANKKQREMRNYYECRCLFIWSSEKDTCFLEGYTSLKLVPSTPSRPWNPAGKVARTLRPRIQSHFGILQKSVRSFVHHVKDGQIVLPLQLILDHQNLIGFRRN